MRCMLTAAAAIALISGVAQAQGNGRGDGQGGGGPAAEQGMRGGGKPDRGGGETRAVGGPVRAEERNSAGNAGPRAKDVARGDEKLRRPAGNRGQGNVGRDLPGDNRTAGVDNRGRRDGERVVIIDRGREAGIVGIGDFDDRRGRWLVAGCPPGLAKKNPPCAPPGQVRSVFRGYDRPDFWGLPWLGDGRYFYDDGYLLRLGPDGRIGGYVPLLGGALAIGNLWPASYQPVALPTYYESYYGLGPESGYRYADNVIYRVDPDTEAITSIAALLTGDDFLVGRPMPAGYDVYNVPFGYREQYYDRPDALYRYSDGYIYQLDPETRLIAAAIELLAS